MYNVNLTSLVRWFLPLRFRGNVTIALIKCLLTSIQNIFNQLSAYRTLKQYELSINSQVIWLEKMLNGLFDPINEGIYIIDVDYDEQVYTYNKSENKRPVYTYNKAESAQAPYIRNKVENLHDYNFTVMVPYLVYQGLLLNNNSNLNAMKANLNKYKMYGTIYKILSY